MKQWIFLLSFALVISEHAKAQDLVFAKGKELFSWNYENSTPPVLVYTSSQPISKIEFDSLRNQILLCNNSGRIRILSSGTFEEVYSTSRYSGYFDQVPKYSFDGKYYVLFKGNTVQLFQTDGNFLLREKSLSNEEIQFVTFTPGGYKIIVGTYSQLIRYNLITREVDEQFDIPFDYPEVAIIDNSDEICIYNTIGEDGMSLFTINTQTWAKKNYELSFFSGEYPLIHWVKYLPGKRPTLIIGMDRSVVEYDLQNQTSREVVSQDYSIGLTKINLFDYLAINTPGKYAMLRDTFKTQKISIFDLSDKTKEISRLDLPLQDEVTAMAFIINNDDISYARVSDKDLRMKLQRQRDVDAIWFSDLGNYIITSGNNSLFTLWDARTLRQIEDIKCNQVPSTEMQIHEGKGWIGCQCENDKAEEVLKVFDINSGKELLENMNPEGISGFSLSEEIFITPNEYDEPSYMIIRQLSTGDSLGSIPTILDRIKYFSKENWIYGLDKGKRAIIYSAATKEVVASFNTDRKAGYIRKIELSPNGEYFLIHYAQMRVGDKVGKCDVFDVKSGEKKYTAELEWGHKEIIFSQDDNILYSLNSIDSVNNQGYNYMAIHRHNITEQMFVQEFVFFPEDGRTAMAYTSRSDKLCLAVKNQLSIYNPGFSQIEASNPALINEQHTSIEFFNDGSSCLVLTGRTVHVVDFQNPSNYRVEYNQWMNTTIDLLGGSFWISDDANRSVYQNDKYKVHYTIKNASNPREERHFTLLNEDLESARIIRNGQVLIGILMKTNKKHDLEYSLVMIDLETRNEISRVKLPELNLLNRERITLSRGNKFAAVCVEKGIIIYDVENNLQTITFIDDALNAYPTNNADEYIIVDKIGQNEYFRDLFLINVNKENKRTHVGTLPDNSSDITVSADGKFVISAFDNKIVKFPIGRKELEVANQQPLDNLLGISSSPKFYCVYGYNEATFFDNENNIPVFSLIASADQGALLKLPSGQYFLISGKRPEFVNFVMNSTAYPFDQFDQFFNAPDKVLKEIGCTSKDLLDVYEKARSKRLKKTVKREFDVQVLSEKLPRTILDNTNISGITEEQDIIVKFWTRDSVYNVEKLNIWVNGVPLHGKEGFYLKEPKKSARHQLKIPLSSGSNHIQVSCSNSLGIESLRESIYVTNTGATQKPRTWFIGIGISNYQDDNFDLSYAAKDIRDLTKMYQEQFPELVVDTLIDEAATLESILNLKQKLLATNVDDEVLVSLSGHGLLDEDLNFFFATYDTNFNNPGARALPYQALQDLLDSIPARKKLVMMDACHSGEIDKDDSLSVNSVSQVKETDAITNKKGAQVVANQSSLGLQNSFELMQELFADLSRGNGAAVISAAGGKEYAYEGKDWKNGVFTYCVRQALEGGKAEKDGNSEITVSELRHFVTSEVTRLTGGRQKPTSRQNNLENDFRIWKLE